MFVVLRNLVIGCKRDQQRPDYVLYSFKINWSEVICLFTPTLYLINLHAGMHVLFIALPYWQFFFSYNLFGIQNVQSCESMTSLYNVTIDIVGMNYLFLSISWYVGIPKHQRKSLNLNLIDHIIRNTYYRVF